MSKFRTIPEINQDYFQNAAMLGDLIFKVDKFEGHEFGPGQIGDLKRNLQKIDKEMDETNKYLERERKKKMEAKTNGTQAAPTETSLPVTDDIPAPAVQ
jgi:hypothetical protein